MKTDTTKQRLIDTGLFIERGGCLFIEETDSILGGEIAIAVTARLRFNSSGELTSVDAYANSVDHARSTDVAPTP